MRVQRAVVGTLYTSALCALLAGCGEAGTPGGIEVARAQPLVLPTATTPPQPEDTVPGFVMHPVEDGQTLWDIARAYDMHVEAILDANGLSKRDIRSLQPGAKLRIPGRSRLVDVEIASDRAARRKARRKPKDGFYHRVSAGESLWTLAARYDVAVEDIMARNRLSDHRASRLREGRALVIPGMRKRDAHKAARAQKRAKGVRHTLVGGETIWDLARRFDVGAGEIMAANGLSERQVKSLREGQKILIPGVTQDKRGRVKRRATRRDRRAQAVARRLGLGTRKVARQLLRGRVKPNWIRAAGGKRRLPGTLRWPVSNGWYVRGYGSGEGGYHLAMDIMGKIGWNVRAAAPGIVAYSGDEVRGYGNLVMVVHPGGWVTMYAHNSVNFVKAGQQVDRGTILAEVGSTGISRGPHVHFELIHHNRNCDPAPLMRPKVKFRRAKHRRIKRVRWTDPDDRPRAIRCNPRRRHPRSRWVVNEQPGR